MSNEISAYSSLDENLTKYKAVLEAALSRFGGQEFLALKVRKVAEQWGGKAMTKRFATALEKELGDDYSVWYGKEYHWDDGPSIRIRETVLRTNDDGTQWRQTVSNDDYLSLREVTNAADVIDKLKLYIESENDVMHNVNEQKRIELANFDHTAETLRAVKLTLDNLKSSLTDKQRDFGKTSYPLRDLIESLGGR